MIYNNEFEIIDTEEKAYFLGLLYSDGCITKKSNVSISLIDEELIKKINTIFPFFNYTTLQQKTIHNNKLSHILRKQNKDLATHLIEKGLINNKSNKNKNIFHFPTNKQVPNDLVNHFIRGYFDGDGSVFYQKLRPNLLKFEITGSSLSIISSIYNYFITNNVLIKYRVKKNKNHKYLDMYTIECIKTLEVLKIRELLYKNATIFLNRKKEKFYNYNPVDKLCKNPNCMKCGKGCCLVNMSIEKIGNYLSQKWYCKNCKKYTRIKLVPLKSEELLENLEIDNQQPSL